jgi:hypothetical protein
MFGAEYTSGGQGWHDGLQVEYTNAAGRKFGFAREPAGCGNASFGVRIFKGWQGVPWPQGRSYGWYSTRDKCE